ncbi:MAG: DNA gyrase inhibitor YacG [Pseudomonadota bacterium]
MARCPICNAETAPDWRPFCSRRCADVDLARWMGERYVLEGRDGEADPDAAASIKDADDTPPKRH